MKQDEQQRPKTSAPKPQRGPLAAPLEAQRLRSVADGVSINGGYPNSWMVYIRENPIKRPQELDGLVQGKSENKNG